MGRHARRSVRSYIGGALVVCAALAFILAVGAPFASATGVSARAATTVVRNHRPLARFVSAPPVATARSGPPGRFPFQSATSADGLVVAHFYQQPTDFGTTFLKAVEAALAHPVADTLGFSLQRRVDIYVYASRGDFLAGADVSNPDETGALTMCDVSSCAIYLEVDTQNSAALADDLPHELTHAVFHQNEDTASIQAYFAFFPLWLDEGLATHDEAHDNYSGPVSDAATNDKLIDLLTVFANNYPTDPDTDYLAYAEAHGFIGYLFSQYGRDAMHGFLADARDGNLDLDAERRFGANLRVLEARWQASLGRPPLGVSLGYVPAAPISSPPPAGALPPVATTLHPFSVPAGGVIPFGWVLTALGCLAAAIILMVGARRRRPEPPAGMMLALPNASPAIELPVNLESPTYPAAYAPALEWVPMSSLPTATATATAPVVDFSAQQPKRVEAQPHWFDATLAVAAAPLIAGSGLLALSWNSLHEWRQGFVVAALAGLICLIGGFAVTLRGRKTAGIPAFRALTLGGLALLALVPWLAATPAGEAQGLAYESRDAYALALRYYADSGVPDDRRNLDLARVHRRWAVAAEAVRDHATAIAQMRAALMVDNTLTAPGDRATLVKDVEAWGEALLGTQQFDAALRVYGDQASSATCDGTCHTTMRQDTAQGELVWGDALLRAGHPAEAAAKYAAILRDYAETSVAATARTAAGETGAQAALANAFAAGETGDIAGMNTQLRAVVQQYSGSVAAGEATATPEPVSGYVSDSSGASAAGDRLFLLGFQNESQARSFDFQFQHDMSVIKVATTLGSGGSFSVRLPPSLWYVACWDDPTQAQYSNFNLPVAAGNDAFYVAPFTPKTGLSITGY